MEGADRGPTAGHIALCTGIGGEVHSVALQDLYGLLKDAPESFEDLAYCESFGRASQGLPPSFDAGRPGDCGAAPAPAQLEVCTECSRKLQLTQNGYEYECPECHLVYESAGGYEPPAKAGGETPGESSLRGRLRVVGVDSRYYQPDMDRTNPVDTSEVQKRSTYTELVNLNRSYVSSGGNAFPLDVLQHVANEYNIVQKDGVRRSNRKKDILSALIHHTCIEFGFTRRKEDITDMVQLNKSGISKGDKYLRNLEEEKLDLNLNKSTIEASVNTTLALLGIRDVKGSPARVKPLQAAIIDIVQTAETRLVGLKSIQETKVIAATAEVLSRHRDSDLNTRRLADVAKTCKKRPATLKNFADVLRKHHKKIFKQVYARHGLSCEKIK